MNNIEVQNLRDNALRFFGQGVADKIDKMSSKQIEDLKLRIDRVKKEIYPSHKEIRSKKIAKRKEIAINGPGPAVSIVIPYMHTEERLPLLLTCLSSLSKKAEICVVEIGKSRNLFLPPEDFKYMFVRYNNMMHRGWALNLGGKHLATGRKLVLLDADVIVPDNFLQIIQDIDYPAVAWNRMFYLDKKSTDEYIEKKVVKGQKNIFKNFVVEEKSEVVKIPRLDGPAGGITILPREIFMKVKGVPENFEGTWGGPDNTFMAKLKTYGYAFRTVNCDSIHLWHSKNTPRNREIAVRARDMIRWGKNEWDLELANIGGGWGLKQKGERRYPPGKTPAPQYMTINYLRKLASGQEPQRKFSKQAVIEDLQTMWAGFDKKTLERVFETKETILSLAMLSLLRTDVMFSMLDHWHYNRFISSNIAFNVQGQEWMSNANKDKVKNKVDKYFDQSNLLFTDGNRGTGVPRHAMIHEALKFNTPYIMTTDDDMFFPPGSVEALISILEDNPEIGAVDMWVHPNLNAWFVGKEAMIYKQPKIPFGFVDAMGSASMIVRREVFETCDYDHNYYVGWADIDFCMQMKKSKWKMAILALPDYKAFNYKARGTEEYRQYAQYRHDAQHAGNSSSRFQSKWGKVI